MLRHRTLLHIMLSLALCQTLNAQLEPKATHFVYNQLYYNPATAGQFGASMIQGMYRAQWVGLEGAPTTGFCSWQKRMLGDRVGLGANLMYNEIGIHKRIQGDMAYSYITPLLNGLFSGGLQASFRYVQQNWADERLRASQSLVLDQAIPAAMSSKLIPNFGFGAYFEQINYYIGFSIPRLVENSIDFAEFGTVLSREPRHIYCSGGFIHRANSNLAISYHFLGNYALSQPFDFDINTTLHWNEKLHTGVSYRFGGDQRNIGDAINAIVGFQASKKILISAGYDFTLSKLKAYSGGSVELAVRYYLGENQQLFGSGVRQNIDDPRPKSDAD